LATTVMLSAKWEVCFSSGNLRISRLVKFKFDPKETLCKAEEMNLQRRNVLKRFLRWLSVAFGNHFILKCS